jgi:hypothetical protein
VPAVKADPARHRQARREDRAHAGDVAHVAERRLDAMPHEERGETSLPAGHRLVT